MEDGLLPHKRSQESTAELEEERRLCYVGFTRAERFLYLTAAARRSVFGGIPVPTEISPYWHDVPAELAEDQGGRPYAPSRMPRGDRFSQAPAPTSLPGEPVYDYSDSQDPDDHAGGLRPGTRVRHPQFGLGTVTAMQGGGRMMRATVRFDRHGTKTLVLMYAHLQPA